MCGASTMTKKRQGRLGLRVAWGGLCTGVVDEIDSGRGKAGYVCALRGDACALARSVDDYTSVRIISLKC